MTPRDGEAPWPAPRPRVHSIALELTGFCNQTCSYCYNAFRDDGGAAVGSADAVTLLARLDRILDAVDLEHVTLTGGEPLASHDLFAVLDGLRRRGVRAQMISNAALVTDAIATRLARYRLMSVLVTLNGPRAEMHDPVVEGAGHFERTVSGIRALVAHRVPVQGSIVITRGNATVVGDTIALFASLGVRGVALSRFSPAGYAVQHARALMPSPADILVALAQAAPFVESHAMQLYATMPLPACVVPVERFPSIEMNQCPIGTARQEFALGPRGEIRHCALHVDPLAGDVLDPSVDLAALFAPGDPHGHHAMLPAACEGCAHAPTCRGGCGAAAWWVHGDRSTRDPFVDGLPGTLARRSLPVLA